MTPRPHNPNPVAYVKRCQIRTFYGIMHHDVTPLWMQIHAGRTMGWQLFTEPTKFNFSQSPSRLQWNVFPGSGAASMRYFPSSSLHGQETLSLSLCLSLPYAIQFCCSTMAVWHMLSFHTCTQTNPKKLVATHPFEGHVLTAPLLFASMAWAVLKKQLDPNKIPSLNKHESTNKGWCDMCLGIV